MGRCRGRAVRSGRPGWLTTTPPLTRAAVLMLLKQNRTLNKNKSFHWELSLLDCHSKLAFLDLISAKISKIPGNSQRMSKRNKSIGISCNNIQTHDGGIQILSNLKQF